MGIAAIVAAFLYFLLVNLLIDLLERWEVDSSVGMNISFSLLSCLLVGLAVTIGMTLPGMIVAGAIAVWVMYMLGGWLLKAGKVEALVIALLTPVLLYGSLYAGNLVERVIVENVLK
ncbi:hypothetical protein SAMN02745181_2409 [Rubritalea squalenifaciens DSM 18772]|uniref:Uncharacterized protein n=2 Tax=Rubritalea squalenifaciens TaxID=407226 RepID=A0A1M6LIX3_9BACT|nr:hypothetical protein SAMN02745181_2409 [Rubritalea squalenifaciens DSM 18772]